MNSFIPKLICLFALLSASTLWAAAASPEEVKKQGEFKKAYGSTVTKDRLAALELLVDCNHPSTMSILSTVATSDADKEVRIHAFRRLTRIPARNTGVAKMLTQIFSTAKLKDEKETAELKQGFAEAAADIEFKFDLGNAMTEYFHRNLRYPDLVVSAQLSAKAQANAREKIEAERKELEEFLTTYNKMFDSDVKNPDKSTPPNIRKFWEKSAGKFAKSDKELTDKYAAEDKEAAKAAK